MTIAYLKIQTTNGLLSYKIRPSFDFEDQDDYYEMLLCYITTCISRQEIINLNPKNYILIRNRYINPMQVIEWYIEEEEINSHSENDYTLEL